jgi:multicomponent Na+:H+ antiporter subunit G
MSALLDGIGIGLCAVGAGFFLAGTLGLLRFPDTLSRLHALTKADNLGLGFIVLGLAVEGGSWALAGKLGIIWLLALLAGSSACYLIARRTDEKRRGGGK